MYQQLTKDNAENVENVDGIQVGIGGGQQHQQQKTSTKARAVLDNLLLNNNNNMTTGALSASNDKEDENVLNADGDVKEEALEHGEKFLKYLEICGEPSVTAMQIMQIRSLLNNIRSSTRKSNNNGVGGGSGGGAGGGGNSDCHNKRVRRK